MAKFFKCLFKISTQKRFKTGKEKKLPTSHTKTHIPIGNYVIK